MIAYGRIKLNLKSLFTEFSSVNVVNRSLSQCWTQEPDQSNSWINHSDKFWVMKQMINVKEQLIVKSHTLSCLNQGDQGFEISCLQAIILFQKTWKLAQVLHRPFLWCLDTYNTWTPLNVTAWKRATGTFFRISPFMSHGPLRCILFKCI